jgi:hypothetical protein
MNHAGSEASPDGPAGLRLAPAPVPVPWTHKLAAVLYCVFCLEVGIFLLVYPWMDAWSRNWLFQLRPDWAPFLISEPFRGAVSGLGVLNLFIAVSEVFRLRRFARRG